MMRRLGAALLAALLSLPAGAQTSSEGPCRRLEHEGNAYAVCTIDLRRYRLDLFWQAPDGSPYGSFDRLVNAPGNHPVAVAMNGGMYHPDRSPVGLHVEGGKALKRASTTDGPGNFHMKPNGVFFVGSGTAGVMETGRFLRANPKADIATQSGPMLVIDGRLHPKISEDGVSRKVRNGVGVKDGRTVVFAISEGGVSFGAFARLFRDELGCPNALYLDGTVSSLYAPSIGRADVGWPMGPILAATLR